MNLVARPGVSDLVCLALLVTGSLTGAMLEPPHRDFWLGFPLLFEIPLLCSALLLLSGSAMAGKVAVFIHVAILAFSGLCLALSLFLLVTILFAGLAVILGPFSVILVFNSVYTLNRIAARKRGR
jgi:hypothetical protein